MTDQPSPAVDSAAQVSASDTTKFSPIIPDQIATSTGVLATAKSAQGGALARDVRENDVVTVRGIEVSISQAERMGLVVLGPDGRYTDADPETAAAALDAATEEPDPEAPDPALAVPFSEEGDAAVGKLSADLQELGLNPVGVLGAWLNNPGQLPQNILDVALERGIDEVAALEQVSAAAGHIEAAFNGYLVREGGVSEEQLEDFWDYCANVVYRPNLATAMNQAIFANNGTAMKAIAREFSVKHGHGLGGLADKESLSAETVQGPGGKRSVRVVSGTLGSKAFKGSVEGLRRAGLY